MANSARCRRVADQIQRELSGIIRAELKDPRIGLVTITSVEVSADLKHARVFFTSFGDVDAHGSAEAGLRSAGGYLRSALARRLRMHNVPELQFSYDASVEQGMRISHLIDAAVGKPRGEG